VKQLLPRSKQRLLSQLRSNPSSLEDNDDPCGADELDLQVGYRRPEVLKLDPIVSDDDDLSEDIRWKLFLIRQLALAKYRESKGA
jgi:hypothetical protein